MQHGVLRFSSSTVLPLDWSTTMSRLPSGGLITILVLTCATFVLLLTIVLTICLSDQVQRNSVFLNFLIITTITAWYFVLYYISIVSPRIEAQDPVLAVEQPAVVLMISVSLFSLLLHVAVVTLNVFRPISTKHRKRIEASLVVIPYLSAPLPLLEYFVTSKTFADAIGCLTTVISLIATIIDVVLLTVFNRYRLKFSQTRIEDLDRPVITNSILLRMSFLCVYRLLTTLAGSLGDSHFGTSLFFTRVATAYDVLHPLYSTIIALVFLQKDILSVWIPFLSSSENLKAPIVPHA